MRCLGNWRADKGSQMVFLAGSSVPVKAGLSLSGTQVSRGDGGDLVRSTHLAPIIGHHTMTYYINTCPPMYYSHSVSVGNVRAGWLAGRSQVCFFPSTVNLLELFTLFCFTGEPQSVSP